jgi:hypothetical protein
LNTIPIHPQEIPMDDPLDAALMHHLSSAPEPADNGFSARVMAALPPQPRRRFTPLADWVHRARWAAMSLSGGGLALLPSASASADVAGGVAVYALIGLLVFWSLPLHWNGD